MITDELLERRLRSEPTGDPSFLASRLITSLQAELAQGEAAEPLRRAAPRVQARLGGGLSLGILAIVVLAVAMVVLRSGVGEDVGATSPPATGGDLLANVRDSGALRIAVRPDFPQASVGQLAGFDVDVASEVAARLGLRRDLVTVDAADMGTSIGWDVAMPSSSLLAASDGFAQSRPYYSFPALLLVPQSSTASAVADLAGSRICVVDGSAGAAWLTAGEGAASTTPVVDPPADVEARTEASEEACLDAVAGDEVEAMITTTLTTADISVRPSLETLGGPVLTEPRSIVATRAGADPTALLAEIDRVLAEMRSDGTLADLSRNRFGGLDLTGP